MVNKVNMALWADGLDSGRFKQGTGNLICIVNGHKRHCCLGVACEVAMEHGVELAMVTTGGGVVEIGGEDGYLPPAVRDWLGLPSNCFDPMLADGVTAVGANDNRGWTFPQIAAALRKRYLEGGGDEPAESD